ncbi:MAG TPA: hypothetical protein DCM14_00615 [Clostridiales bacterium UBA8153]|nr:hypothetical protein [Clostridiales bacterium UBA8153]
MPKGARRIVTRRHKWMVVLLVGVLILGPGAWYWHQLRAGVARLERTKAELGQHLDRLALVSELVNSHEALTARLGTLQELLQTRDRATRFTSYLSELAALLPGGTVLSDISLDRERLAVRGYLASYAEAAALLRALAASEHFTHPRLRFLYQETGRHRFELTAQLRQGTVPK